MNQTKSLTGLVAVVTRPAIDAEFICESMTQLGGSVIKYPVIAIYPPRNLSALQNALQNLHTTDLLIFVSRHAVREISKMLRQHNLTIPTCTKVAAVGPQTARQCAQQYIAVDYVAQQYSGSEGLLFALEKFDVYQKNILIARGQSGRELIKRTLESRGAVVCYIESYRRAPTNLPIANLLARLRAGEVHVIIVTSIALVDGLVDKLIKADANYRKLLARTTAFTYSERVAKHCRAVGFSQSVAAQSPGDTELLTALKKWWGNQFNVIFND